MPQFTLDQKKAHDPWRHISITANAGSGKTRVLVSRYCDIVEYFGAMPDRIAAITFTEKAASELRAKIAEELERRLSSDEHQEQWRLLKIAREKFPSAIVSTIHGFCSQLLREFPIETGVPPNYSVTSGYERRRLVEDSLMEAIEHALNEEENPAFERTYDVARRVGREKMENIIRMMIDKREIVAFSRASGALGLDRDDTLDRWLTQIDNVVRGLLLNAETVPAITAIIEMMKEDKAPDALQALAEARAARSAEELLPRMKALRDMLLTNDGGPRKRLFRLKNEEFEILERPVTILNGAFKRASRFLDASGDPALHGELYDDTQILLHICDDALARYDARKLRHNALDFEDLQLRLLDALGNEEARTRIVRRFDHIMIDEFQDTNELQYAIGRQLLEELRWGHLCIVGDKKQSIYGFRNADVEVFTKASREIERSNRELGREEGPLVFRSERIEPSTREEMLGVIKLTASFRLLPSICAFVNEACEPILKQNTPHASFGVEYEPLLCARRSSGHGAIEFIISSPKPDDAPDAEEEECDIIWCPQSEMIARRLLGLVARGEPVVWDTPPGEESEAARAPHFSDMAILCRKRSHFPAIEAALRKYGVPFVTHGGVGFYRTQEIYDMLNYLRTLLNSRDDIALLGVLRSPFFAVSDAELYRLTLNGNGHAGNGGDDGKDLWSRAKRRTKSGAAEEPLLRAVEMIEDDRAMAGRIPVSLLLRRIIERTGWRGAVIGSERGEQNLANVDKLLEMARDYESRGFTNLFDFVERITEMVELEELEGEAPVNTGRDAVRLMTMHAAKGLEFPIVVLPSLDSPSRVSSEPYFDKELGFGWNWRYNKDEYRPAIVALMGLNASERERAEEARLFYVAVTRARDMLIVSGEYDRNSPPTGTMLNWALAPFEEVPASNTTVLLRSETLGFLEPDGESVRRESWEQSVAFHLDIEDLPKYAPYDTPPVPFRAGAVRIGELPARAEGEIYSATQFLIYSQCPTKYYLKYRLGIPEEIGEAYGLNAEGRDNSEDATAFARVFRRTALSLDRAIDRSTGLPIIEPNEHGKRPLETIIDESLQLEPLVPKDLDAMRARMLESFDRLLTSEPARAILFPSGYKTFVDYELTMPFGTEYLLGVIDRVIEHPDGTLTLVQYKTRQLDRADLRRAAESYLPQLRVYAYLISALNPDQSSVTGTLIFTEFPEEPQSFNFSRFEALRIEEELRSHIGDIRALSYTGRRELPLRTPHCPDCPYWIEGACLLARAEEGGRGGGRNDER